MTRKFGDGFVAMHITTATRMLPLLAQDSPQRLDWSRVERDLHAAGYPDREALASELVVAAAGFLAEVGGLHGECVECALEPLQGARILRPADVPAAFAAMDAAATLAVGLLREPCRPDGVTLAQWLRGSWAAAYVTHEWLVSYQSAA